MNKIKVLPVSPDLSEPFAHLEPMISKLIHHGNATLTNPWFAHDRDGWFCLLRLPIDSDLLEATFDVPDSISLSRESDSILDTSTWTQVKGGGAFA